MALAEHDRIGFYTSPNLREWTYTSDFVTTGLGVLECPDLFPMSVDGDPDDVRWVLVAGANGAAEGMTTGTAYWVGEWDGERFIADGTGHQWLDHGAGLLRRRHVGRPAAPRSRAPRRRATASAG